LVKARVSLFYNPVQPSYGVHPPSNSMGDGVPSLEESGQDLKLAPYFHLVPTLRMSGGICLLPLCTIMVCIGKTLLVLINNLLGNPRASYAILLSNLVTKSIKPSYEFNHLLTSSRTGNDTSPMHAFLTILPHLDIRSTSLSLQQIFRITQKIVATYIMTV